MSTNRKRKASVTASASTAKKRITEYKRFRQHAKWIQKGASLVLQQKVLALLESEPTAHRRGNWVTNWPQLFASWRLHAVAVRDDCRRRFIDAVETIKNQTSAATRGERADRRSSVMKHVNDDRLMLQRAYNLVSSGRPVRLGCFVLPLHSILLADGAQARTSRVFPLPCEDEYAFASTVPDAFCWARCCDPPDSTLSLSSHPVHQTVVAKAEHTSATFQLLEDCHYSMSMPAHLVEAARDRARRAHTTSTPTHPPVDTADATTEVDDSSLSFDASALERTECWDRHLNGVFLSRPQRSGKPYGFPDGFRQMRISNYQADPRPDAATLFHTWHETESLKSFSTVYRKIHSSTRLSMRNIASSWPQRDVTLPIDTWCTSLVEIMPIEHVVDGRRMYAVQHLLVRVMWQETELYYSLLDTYDTSVLPVIDIPRELWALVVTYAFPCMADQSPDLVLPGPQLNPPLRSLVACK